MYCFIRFGFPVKSESGYNIAGIKVPRFAKGQDYLVQFITAISQCQAALPKNKQQKPSPESSSVTVCCVSKCLLSEKSRGKDLCIWPSWFTDESLETQRDGHLLKTHTAHHQQAKAGSSTF